MIEQPEPGELVLTGRWRLDAAPARVFTLVTEPDALAEWWGPHGFTTPEAEIDLRVGGGYRFTMQPPEVRHSTCPANSSPSSSPPASDSRFAGTSRLLTTVTPSLSYRWTPAARGPC